mmetsp:Transcript_16842/g.2756  ORF Transcript_16842/g.2756 Transcript_16842/m.2756 type:complete len:120 (+) Transcript_16842:438-797(+)
MYPIVSPTPNIGSISLQLSADKTLLLTRQDSSWDSSITYEFYTALQTGTVTANEATVYIYFISSDVLVEQIITKSTNITTNTEITPETAADLPTTGPFTISENISLPTAPDAVASLTAD